MFRNLFDTIVGTISNMNPLKHFIKYALDKTLNEFLKKELTLQDFKNGPLNLQNIQINTDKINKSHLVSSPYILHFGVIGNLKIILPPLSDLSTQSIEISISGVQIILKPNKKFSENFKQKMVELHEMEKYYVQEKEVQGEISQTGPVDFFKQLLKKIIINIKVNISNIAIKLYMNTPSEDKSTPQFYLMLRIPLIYLDKKQDKQIKKNEVEQLSFNILLPQISVHLLSEDIKSSEYPNMKCGQGDFPFLYPTVNHPRTILLIGSPIVPENMVSKLPQWKKDGRINAMNFTQVGFKLTTDYKKKTKDITLHLEISNIESMVTPVQIKILSRFVAQVMEFKKILDNIIQELKFQSGQSVNFIKRKSNDSLHKSSNNDLFSSIMMSLSNQMGTTKQQVRESDMFKSIMRQDKLMRESVREFNLQFEKKMKKMQGTQTLTVEFQVIEFKQSLKIHIQFSNLAIYILKYTTNQDYLRIWRHQVEKAEYLVNKKIGCDYFMFEIKKIDVLVKTKQKLTYVNIKSLTIFNVKLCEGKLDKSEDSFYEIGDSVDFQASKANTSGKGQVYQIKQFTPSNHAHFCVEEILTISQSESQNKKQELNIKKYSFIPQVKHGNEDAYILYKPALSFHLDNKQKYFKINLEIIAVTANLQLILDLLHIVYPLMAYKRLSDIVNFKRAETTQKSQQYGESKSHNSKKNIFESMYEYRLDVQSFEDLQSQNKNTLVFEIVEAKISFRKGETSSRTAKGLLQSNFGDLIRKEKQKVYEQQSFQGQCFCGINEMGIYFELQNLKLQKKLSALKVSCKIIDIGLMKIQKSQITGLSSILSVKTIRPDDSIRLLKQNTHCETILLYVPELNARFSESDIVEVAALTVDSIKIIGELISFKDYLQREIMLFERKSSDYSKKQKKAEGSTQKQFKFYIERISVELDYCTLSVEQIYFNLNQIEESITCKVSKIIGGIKRQKPLKLKLCQFKNDVMQASLYPESCQMINNGKHKDKLIADGDTFFQIYDSEKSHLVFKAQQRNAFFEKLDKQNFSLIFQFSKRELESQSNFMKKESSHGSGGLHSKWLSRPFSGQNTLSQKFKFKQVNPAIEQEGQKKIIIVQVSKQIRLYACNILQLKKYLQKVQKFAKFLQNKKKQVEEKLKAQTMLTMERKHSAEIESQSLEIIVKMGPSLIIDIRPDFLRNENEKVFSSTRSIVTLNLYNSLCITIHKDKNFKQISGEFSLSYHFLNSNDRDVDINPLVLKQERHLNELGFKNILEINKLNLKMSLGDSCKSFSIKVKSILGEASLQTLCLIQLHLEHLINHHIKNQIGISQSEIYDGDDFQVLEYDAECDPDLNDVIIVDHAISDSAELQIEDLSGALEIYQEKLNNKKKEENILRARSYAFEPCKNPQISIEQLRIEKVCFRISSNNDFDFVKFNVSQSIASKRVRIKQPEEMDFYVFEVTNLTTKLDLERSEPDQKLDQEGTVPVNKGDLNVISSFCKLQRIGIYFGRQKHYGHSSLKYLQNLAYQSCFVICANQNQICVVFQKNSQKILLKTYCLKLKIGGTTQILSTMKKVKSLNQQIGRSGWRKIYDRKEGENSEVKQSKLVKKDTKVENQRIIVMIPDSSLRVTFQYANYIKIVDEQLIEMKQFILNEEAKDKFQIQLKIRRWLKALAKNNLGSLIGGTALNLLVKLFSQLVKLNVWWLSKILGFFFGGPD